MKQPTPTSPDQPVLQPTTLPSFANLSFFSPPSNQQSQPPVTSSQTQPQYTSAFSNLSTFSHPSPFPSYLPSNQQSQSTAPSPKPQPGIASTLGSFPPPSAFLPSPSSNHQPQPTITLPKPKAPTKPLALLPNIEEKNPCGVVYSLRGVIKSELQNVLDKIEDWLTFKNDESTVNRLKKLEKEAHQVLEYFKHSNRSQIYINPKRAKRVLEYWKCARELKERKDSKLALPKELPSITTQSRISFPKKKQKVSKEEKVKMNLLDFYGAIVDGQLIRFDKKNNKRIRAAEQKKMSEIKVQVEQGDEKVEYLISLKTMTQTNVITKTTRPIYKHISEPSSGPSFWNNLPNPLLPALQDDKLRGIARMWGALTATVLLAESAGFQVLAYNVNINLKNWENYCTYRESIKIAEPELAQEMILCHGTSKKNAKSFINGTNRLYTETHAYGRGVYFATKFSYSAQKQYAEPYTDVIEGKTVHNVQTIIPTLVTFGSVAVGTPDMVQPPLKENSQQRVTGTVNFDKNIYVLFRDQGAYPIGTMLVRKLTPNI
jgi:hypothetical protein